MRIEKIICDGCKKEIDPTKTYTILDGKYMIKVLTNGKEIKGFKDLKLDFCDSNCIKKYIDEFGVQA